MGALGVEEGFDRLFEAAVEEVLVARVRDQGRGEGRGRCPRASARGLHGREARSGSDGIPEVSFVGVGRLGFQKARSGSDGIGEAAGHMKPVDRIQKKQRPHPLVEIRALVAEGFERGRLVEQLLEACPAADRINGAVPRRRIGCGDDVDEVAGGRRNWWHGRR